MRDRSRTRGAAALEAAALGVLLASLLGAGARAQETPQRRVELTFTPTARVQMAVWIQSADGARFATIALTEAVAYRGIGNRPGALQMNSGFRYPYGRREGVLPIWAHRRIEHGEGAFPRVIFDGRRSEGHASSALSPGERFNTRDEFFCLSFNESYAEREALDAITCASIFSSNKGRYLSEADLGSGYAEPFEEEGGVGMMRPLSLASLYPPRRDVGACSSCGPDVGRFVSDARAAMPEIDAVTLATPPANRASRLVFVVPEGWPDGDYLAFLEVSTEGDYNERWNDERFPTPRDPDGLWDVWAVQYGYPYRGQPSVLYRVPLSLRSSGDEAIATEPVGYGALHGEDGEVRPLDGTITDDPEGAPGSGADRLLRAADGRRLHVQVPRWDICDQPEPPPECGETCVPGERCGPELICAPDATCVGLCDLAMAPDPVSSLSLTPHEDRYQSHHFAHLRFRAPRSSRGIARYEVRVSAEPINSEQDYLRALPANAATLESEALVVPTEAAEGELIEVELGGLSPESRYFVAVRAYDECAASGPFSVAEGRTTAIHFTTVSPCFVATAAYGTPMAEEIRALRRFRDRQLRSDPLGRALVRAYYAVSPPIAAWIGAHEEARAAARALLAPVVALFTE